MAKKPTPKGTPQGAAIPPHPSVAYKPHLIGAVIETLMEKHRTDKKVLAAFMNVKMRTLERWLTMAYLDILTLTKLSEFFGENLLALYHPNVLDPPHPLQAKIAELENELESYRGTRFENEELKKEILKLEGRLEEAEEMLERWRKRP